MSGVLNRSELDECLDWIYTQRTNIETAKYGRNEQMVKAAIAEQRAKGKVIEEYKREVDRVSSRLKTEEERNKLKTAYESLLEISEKKINCLNTMVDITALEDNCGNLGHDIDLQAVQMVAPTHRAKLVGQKTGDQQPGFIAPSSQDCIFAAKDNWNWIIRLVQCIEIHAKNASAYHQFFHEADESSIFMLDDIKRLYTAFESIPLRGDFDDAQRLLKELGELAVSLRQWETKSNFLWDQGIKVVPVHLRTQGIKEPTPVRSLIDYETNEISIREGEDLLLLDNSLANMWKVRNCRGQEALVPALGCLIPGPFKEAVEAAIHMRLKLMAAWTNVIKRTGQRLICFMLIVFKPRYNEDEIRILRSIRMTDKKNLLQILEFIEDTLKPHWGDHEAFIELQERLLALRMILDENTEQKIDDESVNKALVVQITTLETIMEKYRDLWRDWELYKVALDVAQAPELMLIVDKWEQLQYVTREYFSRFWQTNLQMTDEEKRMAGLRSLTSSEFIDESLMSESSAFSDYMDDDSYLYGDDESSMGRPGSKGYSKDAIDGGSKTTSVTTTSKTTKTTRDGTHGDGSMGTSDTDGTFGDDTKGFSKTTVKETTMYSKSKPGDDDNEVSDKVGDGSMGDESMGGSKSRTGEDDSGLSEKDTDGKMGDGSMGVRWSTLRDSTLDSKSRGGDGESGLSDSNRDGTMGDGSMGGSVTTVRESTIHSKSRTGDGAGGDSDRDRGGNMGDGGTGLSDSMMRESSEYRKTASGSHSESITRESTSSSQSMREDSGSMGSGASQDASDISTKPQTFRKSMITEDENGFRTETITEVTLGFEQQLQSAQQEDEDGTDFGYATETRTADTEELSSAEREEKKTFIIRSVVDPRNEEEVSLQDAIMYGIINPETGNYVNIDTGETMPIPMAMASGKIKVEFTKVRRTQEKKVSFGVITVKTIKEHVRPFVILGAKDTFTGQMLSKQEASNKGIVNEKLGVYKDTRNNTEMIIADAVDKGLVDVQDDGQPQPEPEVVSQTYAVRAVVDRRAKKLISFQDAIRRGIIDKEAGQYKDNSTGEMMYIGDAIMRGFLKARKIDDAKGISIDPANQMVIDKTEMIRKKLLQPLGVISAFRKAAAANK